MEKRLTVAEGMMELMAILGDAPVKANKEVAAKEEVFTPVANVVKVSAPVACVYENGHLIEINGKKTAVGPKKKGKRGGVAKNDPGKDALKEVYVKAFECGNVFTHSTEGFIIRESEADYAIKVSKAKAPKYDPTEEDFAVEKDFAVRGKAKNSAPRIAKCLLTALEGSDLKFELISARASGIIVHMNGGEYTIKIAKKRDRVGFEAEKAAAYN